MLASIKVEIIMSQPVGEAHFRSKKIAVCIFHLQKRITGDSSRQGIMMTGRELLVVGNLSNDGSQILRVKSCTHTDSSGLVGFQHEYQFIGFIIR